MCTLADNRVFIKDQAAPKKKLKAKHNHYKHLEASGKKATFSLYCFLFAFMVNIVVYSLYLVVIVVIIIVNFDLVLLYRCGAMR